MKVPPSTGAPVFAVLIIGREDVTLVNSESVASPLAAPATARCPSGQWTSYDALVLSARATVAFSTWAVMSPNVPRTPWMP